MERLGGGGGVGEKTRSCSRRRYLGAAIRRLRVGCVQQFRLMKTQADATTPLKAGPFLSVQLVRPFDLPALSSFVCIVLCGPCTSTELTSCARGDTTCLRRLQVDNIFVFIRQVAPVPSCWLFKTSATT